eukprot:TRINITY_DN3261_c0_g1_i1.p1 TRINITY_DN3261_c0_g1~~TRINITY_DN3261_c0_g1_i1.p1  ORF type:complete len:425 (+),score=88.75 TRINITY_DN3261_c0_g1_i1:37-1311(+)
MSTVKRVHFLVTIQAEGAWVESVQSFQVDAPPGGNITFNWIQESLDALELKLFPLVAWFGEMRAKVQRIVSLKYEDDEKDHVTFSSQSEVEMALGIISAAKMEVFEVFAVVVAEPNIVEVRKPGEDSFIDAFEDEKYNEGDQFLHDYVDILPSPQNQSCVKRIPDKVLLRAVLRRFSAYVESLENSDQQAIAEKCVCEGLHRLKHGENAQELTLNSVNMLPAETDTSVQKKNNLTNELRKVTAEQWQEIQDVAKCIPQARWEIIEQSVHQLFTLLPRIYGKNPTLPPSTFELILMNAMAPTSLMANVATGEKVDLRQAKGALVQGALEAVVGGQKVDRKQAQGALVQGALEAIVGGQKVDRKQAQEALVQGALEAIVGGQKVDRKQAQEALVQGALEAIVGGQKVDRKVVNKAFRGALQGMFRK